MLILEIAAGIILGFVVLAYWPALLIGAGFVALIALVAGVSGSALVPAGVSLLAVTLLFSNAKFADALGTWLPDWTDKSLVYMIGSSFLAVCAIGGVVRLCAWVFNF